MCLSDLCSFDLPRADKSGLMRGWKIVKAVWNDWGGGWAYLTSSCVKRKPPIKYHPGWNISRASYKGQQLKAIPGDGEIKPYTIGYHVLRYKDRVVNKDLKEHNRVARKKFTRPLLWLPVYYKSADVTATGFQIIGHKMILIAVAQRIYIITEEYEKAVAEL